jgi:aspartyl-tRNA synthetase
MNGKAQDLMMSAPTEVSEKQLGELGINLRMIKKANT